MSCDPARNRVFAALGKACDVNGKVDLLRIYNAGRNRPKPQKGSQEYLAVKSDVENVMRLFDKFGEVRPVHPVKPAGQSNELPREVSWAGYSAVWQEITKNPKRQAALQMMIQQYKKRTKKSQPDAVLNSANVGKKKSSGTRAKAVDPDKLFGGIPAGVKLLPPYLGKVEIHDNNGRYHFKVTKSNIPGSPYSLKITLCGTNMTYKEGRISNEFIKRLSECYSGRCTMSADNSREYVVDIPNKKLIEDINNYILRINFMNDGAMRRKICGNIAKHCAEAKRHGVLECPVQYTFDEDGYDRNGRDFDGFDRKGCDREGYGRNGYNRKGFNRAGFDKDGFDKDGWSIYGFDREGFDENGRDILGFDKNGVDLRGNKVEDYDNMSRVFVDICPHCKEDITNDYYHSCQTIKRSGFVTQTGTIVQDRVMPFNVWHDTWKPAIVNDPAVQDHIQYVPGRPPGSFAYNGVSPNRKHTAYNRKDVGYYNNCDIKGRDINGYDEHGFDQRGRNKNGFDRYGYDEEGYDIDGYDRQNRDRDGNKRKPKLQDVMNKDTVQTFDKDMADMYSRIITTTTGKKRRVVLIAGGRFSTNMKGIIKADPEPLGALADPRKNMVVTRAGIGHELGHELFTGEDIFERWFAIVDGREESVLGSSGRELLRDAFNIIEDGRMERCMARKYPGFGRMLAASCRVKPRWDRDCGEESTDAGQFMGAMLYESLPFFEVGDTYNQMSDKARSLYDEYKPQIQRVVNNGTAEDALKLAVEISKRMEDDNLVDIPDGTIDDPYDKNNRPPAPDKQQDAGGGAEDDKQGSSQGSGSGAEDDEQGSSQGSGSGAEDDEQGDDQGSGSGAEDDEQGDDQGSGSGAEDDEQGDGQGSGSGAEDDEQGDGQGSGSSAEDDEQGSSQANQDDAANNEFAPLSDEELDAIMDETERDAVTAVRQSYNRRFSTKAISKEIHKPLSPTDYSRDVKYIDSNGDVTECTVHIPNHSPHPDIQAYLDNLRQNNKIHAQRLAKKLRLIKEQTDRMMGAQREGTLDPRRYVPAIKGGKNVRARIKEMPETSMAVSIITDVSGSMKDDLRSGKLFESTALVCDTLEALKTPYEAYTFSNNTFILKSMDDKKINDSQLYDTVYGESYLTYMQNASAISRTSLNGREENNRLMIAMTDGDLSDHEATVNNMEKARQDGIVTFGIFLGNNPPEKQLNEIYGQGSWVNIHDVSEYPEVVGKKLEHIFRSKRNRNNL